MKDLSGIKVALVVAFLFFISACGGGGGGKGRPVTAATTSDTNNSTQSSCVVDSGCENKAPYSCDTASYCYQTVSECNASNECGSGGGSSETENFDDTDDTDDTDDSANNENGSGSCRVDSGCDSKFPYSCASADQCYQTSGECQSSGECN